MFNALKYGASGYLLKGISTKELIDAVRKVYHGTAVINEDIASKVVKLFYGALDQSGVVNYTWKDALDSNGTQLFNAAGTECFLPDEKVETALVFMEKLQNINGGYPVTTKDFDLGNVVF